MLSRLKMDLRTVVVAAVTAAVTAGTPSLADGVRHALFSHNSDKVDGKHAVSSRVAVEVAGKKLVAHDRNGQLPAKFIAPIGTEKLADGAVTASKLGMIVERVESVTIEPNRERAGIAECGEGETVISGGAGFQTISPGKLAIKNSVRVENGWLVGGYNMTSSDVTLQVRAYCLVT